MQRASWQGLLSHPSEVRITRGHSLGSSAQSQGPAVTAPRSSCESGEEKRPRTTFQRFLFKNKSEAGAAKASVESKKCHVQGPTCRGPLAGAAQPQRWAEPGHSKPGPPQGRQQRAASPGSKDCSGCWRAPTCPRDAMWALLRARDRWPRAQAMALKFT